MLNKVTITGADNGTNPQEMAEISEDFPFVEWGILVMPNKKHDLPDRFPSKAWINENLRKAWFNCKSLRLSAHLCKDYARQICDGKWDFLDDHLLLWTMVDRIQINLRKIVEVTPSLIHGVRLTLYHGIHNFNKRQTPVILQTTSFTNDLLLQENFRFNCIQALFDVSAGNGILPENWPSNDVNFYTGYAGGLTPENLQENLEKMNAVATKPYWIDVESGVRTGCCLDMHKVRAFLEIAEKYITS